MRPPRAYKDCVPLYYCKINYHPYSPLHLVKPGLGEYPARESAAHFLLQSPFTNTWRTILKNIWLQMRAKSGHVTFALGFLVTITIASAQGRPASTEVEELAPAVQPSPLSVEKWPAPMDLLLTRNRKLLAAEQKRLAALEAIKTKGVLPDPMFSNSFFLQSIETRNGPMENQIMLGQKFPLWGKLSRQRKVATLMAEKATFNLETLQVMVVFQMNKNYANYLKLKRSLEILEQYQEELDSFRKVALTQYSTGTGMTQHPILKLQIERALVESKINSLQTKLDAVENTLQALFDGAFSPDLFPPDWDIVVPIDSAAVWLKLAEVTHPGYLQARTNLYLAQVQQELATRKNYPDIVTGLTYTSIGPTTSMSGNDPGADAFGVKLGLNLPLWFRRNKARVESATLNVKAHEELVADVWNDIEQEVYSVVLQRDEIEETYQLYYGGLLQEADQMVSSAFSAYETGKISFLDLLDSERMAVRIRLEFEAVIAERRIAAAQLLKAVGLIDLNEE